MKGIGLSLFGAGMVVAAVSIVTLKPAPVITFNLPSLTGSKMFSQDFPYSRFSSLPELNVEGGRDQLLQQSIRRVTLRDGQAGVRVTILLDGKSEGSTSQWI